MVAESGRDRVEKPIEFTPGERVGSKFEIVGRLTEGATAIIYVAKEGDREVAVKLLRPERQFDPKAVESFGHEMKTRSRVADDIFEQHDVYFIAKFYKGKTFRAHIAEQIAIHGTFSGTQCIQIALDIATYLAAFENDVVHGDIKPENVILEARHGGFTPRIVDYGTAQLELEVERRARSGTAQYEAPEICRSRIRGEENEAITPAADVYALGVILYECYAGVPPFRHADSAEVRRMHVDGDVDFDRLRRKSCPKPIVEIIRGCLEKNVKRRWSARQVADALRPLVLTTEDTKAPSSGPKRATESDRHAVARRFLYAGFALVLVSTGAVALRVGIAAKPSSPAPSRPPTVFAAALPSSPAAPSLLAAAAKRIVRKGPVPRLPTATEIKQQCALVDGTDYACVPGGRYAMGATDATVDERCQGLGSDCVPPVRELLKRAVPEDGAPLDTFVSTFAMMRSPVTCTAYAEWLDSIRQDADFDIEYEREGENGTEPRARYPRRRGKRIYDLFASSSCIVRDPATKTFSAIPALANHPVGNIPWSEANQYCTEHHGSLPTEAQFMRVRLWNQSGPFVWGATEPSCSLIAFDQPASFKNYDHLHLGECRGLPSSQKGPRDVGSSQLDVVTKLGIHDLGANVRQWARDGFVEHLPACPGACVDPLMPPQPSGAFVMMGGSYAQPRWYLYSLFRGQYRGDSNENNAGFRCVKNLPTRRGK
jgi:serine/threonine protein kinase/formylglycine-generating enzyme required for sulfatase activity